MPRMFTRALVVAAVVVGTGARPTGGEASDAGGFGEDVATAVVIDVLPGVDPNHITVGSGAEIPVALLTTPTFDASSVDGSTLCFGDADDVAARDCTEAHGAGHAEDVDRDGDRDLVLHYQEPETGIDADDTRACLNGRTRDGAPVEGCDDIVTG